MTYVFNTTETIARHLREGQLICLESTTYPGTTDEDMRTILERTSLKAAGLQISPFPPSARTPTTGTFRQAPSRRSWEASTKNVSRVVVLRTDTIVDSYGPAFPLGGGAG